MSTSISKRDRLDPKLREYLDARVQEESLIDPVRRDELREAARYLQAQRSRGLPARLNFICTHNSRRSHLAQIWAHVAATYFNQEGLETYSGGTEATAFNPRAVAALRETGLQITTREPEAANPRYEVSAGADLPTFVCFSKVYHAAPNPDRHFAAVMTCSDADEACPRVVGADLRLAIRYEDPKVADGTSEEADRYRERSQQICREMLYLMAHV